MYNKTKLDSFRSALLNSDAATENNYACTYLMTINLLHYFLPQFTSVPN